MRTSGQAVTAMAFRPWDHNAAAGIGQPFHAPLNIIPKCTALALACLCCE